MPWHAHLELSYRVEQQRCVARYRHDGPLRILQSLYPEGERICHNVLVHPPGGLVGGDTLDLQIEVGEGAHGLVTTPGAARFYRSEGALALQHTRISLAAGARFEWLPLEALCYSGCLAENRVTLDLADGAELIGWDITGLGLPHADQPFVQGYLQQHLGWSGHWLERGRIAANDLALMNGPTGLAGRRCVATLFLLGKGTLDRSRRELALDAAREAMAACHGAPGGEDHDRVEATLQPLAAGATAVNDQVVVVRVLSPVVEPAMQLLRSIRAAWRVQLWGLDPTAPRIWSM